MNFKSDHRKLVLVNAISTGGIEEKVARSGAYFLFDDLRKGGRVRVADVNTLCKQAYGAKEHYNSNMKNNIILDADEREKNNGGVSVYNFKGSKNGPLIRINESVERAELLYQLMEEKFSGFYALNVVDGKNLFYQFEKDSIKEILSPNSIVLPYDVFGGKSANEAIQKIESITGFQREASVYLKEAVAKNIITQAEAQSAGAAIAGAVSEYKELKVDTQLSKLVFDALCKAIPKEKQASMDQYINKIVALAWDYGLSSPIFLKSRISNKAIDSIIHVINSKDEIERTVTESAKVLLNHVDAAKEYIYKTLGV